MCPLMFSFAVTHWQPWCAVPPSKPNSLALSLTRLTFLVACRMLRWWATQSTLEEAASEVHKQLHLSQPRMYLFDLEANPSESVTEDCGVHPNMQRVKECSNLYNIPAFKDVRRKLEGIMKRAEMESVPPTMRWTDDGPLADPMSFGGWVPWRDESGDPLASYAGLTYDENSEKDGADDFVDPHEISSVIDAHQVGLRWDNHSYRVSSTSASGIAMIVALFVVGSTWLAYRAGRRSGYENLVK